MKLVNAFLDDLLQLGRNDLGVRLDDDLAGLGVDDVVEGERTLKIGDVDLDLALSSACEGRRSRTW